MKIQDIFSKSNNSDSEIHISAFEACSLLCTCTILLKYVNLSKV